MFEGFDQGDKVYVKVSGNSDSGDMAGIMSYVGDEGVYMLVTHAMQRRGELTEGELMELADSKLQELSRMSTLQLRVVRGISAFGHGVWWDREKLAMGIMKDAVAKEAVEIEQSVMLKPLMKPIRTFLSAGIIDRIDALDDLNEHFVLNGLDFDVEGVHEEGP